ncbi:MAG: EAL domain-containing protein [Lautropia sp.]|nr:EAL domain-containing protein [Lautropia sp.]
MNQHPHEKRRLSGSRQLAGWVLLLITVSYLIWLFAYPMAYSKPDQVLPYKILASAKSFNELANVLGPLREQAAPLGGQSAKMKTLWVLARIPADTEERTRVLHLANRSILKGDAVVLDEFGQALLYSHFSQDLEPVHAERALPGYSIVLPELPLPLPAGHRRFSGEHDLTLVLRLELSTTGPALALNLWDSTRFVEAQRQIEQQGTMLGSILVLLAMAAFVGGQLMHIPVMRLLAFWLGARAAYLMSAGGYLHLWLGTSMGGVLGTALDQVAQMSLPSASLTLMWGLMEYRLKGQRFGAWMHGMAVVGVFALAVAGLLPPEVFQTLLYLVAGAVIVTVAGLAVVNLRHRVSMMSIWYLCTPLLDGLAAANTLVYLLGITQAPFPWLDLQSTSLLAVMNASTAVIGYLARERSKELKSQEATKDALDRYQETYKTIPIGLLSFDHDAHIERYNEVSSRLFDVPVKDGEASLPAVSTLGDANGALAAPPVSAVASMPAQGRGDADTLMALNAAFPDDLRERIQQDLSSFDEADFVWLLHGEGTHRWLRVQAQRTATGYDVSLTDVTALKQAESHLIYESQHDKLTGALNRHGLDRRIESCLSDPERAEHLAICYVDLDRFKVLNDVFGHQAGDAVLRDVVQRLKKRLGDQVEIARMGGDEFALLLSTNDPPHRLQAYRALDAIAGRPFEIAPKRFAVTASIGLCRANAGQGSRSLIDAADNACREAKRKGRNQVVIMEEGDQGHERERHQVEIEVLDRLRKTKAFSDFELAIQPVVGLGDGNRLGGEILLRHRMSDGSLRSPTSLIEAAVYRGEMATIDRWVLIESLRWLARHERAFRALDFISVNLSAEALSDEAFKNQLIGQVRRHQPVASKLVLEINEVVAMQDGYMMKRLIGTLRQLGVRAALDNVGAGFINLNAIGDIGASYLKIDGSFTESLTRHGGGQAVLRTLAVLAQELGIASIAKSVQSASVLPVLEAMGIDYAQGQALGAPMSLADFETLVNIGAGTAVRRAGTAAASASAASAEGMAGLGARGSAQGA